MLHSLGDGKHTDAIPNCRQRWSRWAAAIVVADWVETGGLYRIAQRIELVEVIEREIEWLIERSDRYRRSALCWMWAGAGQIRGVGFGRDLRQLIGRMIFEARKEEDDEDVAKATEDKKKSKNKKRKK